MMMLDFSYRELYQVFCQKEVIHNQSVVVLYLQTLFEEVLKLI